MYVHCPVHRAAFSRCFYWGATCREKLGPKTLVRGARSGHHRKVVQRSPDVNRRHDSPPHDSPWERVIGLRVGIVAGGFFGAAIVAITGVAHFETILTTTLVGGFLGWWSRRRK